MSHLSFLKWVVRWRQGRVQVAEVKENRGEIKMRSVHVKWARTTLNNWSLANEVKGLLSAFIRSVVSIPPVLRIDTTSVEPVDHMALTVAGCAMHSLQSHECLSLAVGPRWHSLAMSLTLSIDFPLTHVIYLIYCICWLSPTLFTSSSSTELNCAGHLSVDR